jgi:2-hydroxycyclohexanecarboxyl-CoA dehydrogenase
MMRFKEKAAIVLGAGGRDNMGQAIARRLAAEGAQVLVSGRNTAELDRLASEIGGAAQICDITRETDIETLAGAAIARWGRLDIAVDCTGCNRQIPFLDTTQDDLRQLYDIQFKGPFQFLQVMVRTMMTHGGAIVRLSSAASSILLDDYAAYRGTKAALDQVARSVADEFGAQGIRVNTISPGLVHTPMTDAACRIPGVIDAFAATTPLGRIATVDEIAAAVAWLASDECFMTGENLHISGGLMLRSNPRKADIERATARAMSDRDAVGNK